MGLIVCVFVFFNFKDDLTLRRDELWVNSLHLCELVNAPLSLEKKEYVPVMEFKQISCAFVSPCRALRNYTLLGTQFGVRLEIMSVSDSV